jgi:SurA-like N-terminal domain
VRRFALLALVALVTGCGQAVPSSAIAVVGGTPVPRADLDAQMAATRQAYAAAGRAFPAAGTAAYEHLRQLAVQLLVDAAALEFTARRLGIEVAAAQVDRRLRLYKLEQFGGDESRYRERLRQTGMTDAAVRAAIRHELLAAAIRRDKRSVAPPKIVYAKGFTPANGR